jgi:hypothetical protein
MSPKLEYWFPILEKESPDVVLFLWEIRHIWIIFGWKSYNVMDENILGRHFNYTKELPITRLATARNWKKRAARGER